MHNSNQNTLENWGILLVSVSIVSNMLSVMSEEAENTIHFHFLEASCFP